MNYIENKKEHHNMDELTPLFKEYEVDFNERYFYILGSSTLSGLVCRVALPRVAPGVIRSSTPLGLLERGYVCPDLYD
jgi:hypothetical protein